MMKTIPLTLLVLALAATSHAAPTTPPPNIVHILADDLGWQDPACFYRAMHPRQEPVYETPNMDRLARRGKMFLQAYSPAPSCSPSRAAYMAGQWTTHTGVVHVGGGLLPRAYNSSHACIDPFYPARLDLETPNIAQALRRAGYQTGHVAKWHVGGKSDGYPCPVDHGFEFGWQNGMEHVYNDPDLWQKSDRKRSHFGGIWSPLKPRHTGFASSRDPEDLYTLDDDGRPYDSTVDMVVRWMDKAKDRPQPFFMNFCPFFVHGPIATRDRRRLEHYCEKMGIPFPDDPGKTGGQTEGHVNPYYASMLDSLDWQVGKVLDFLESTDDPRNPGHKLIDNTYVILSADNGGCTGLPITHGRGAENGESERVTDNSPLRAGKQEVYEGGIRIPFIVSGPGVAPGSTNSGTPISLIDLFPTFLDMARTKPAPEMELDGCDLMPVFLGKDTEARFADGRPRESLYFHYPVVMPASSVIRKGDWKLLLYHAPELDRRRPRIQLFRLYNEDGTACDLGEKENLAETHPEKRDELLGELQAWLAKHDAVLPYRNADRAGDPLPGSERTPKVLARDTEGDRVSVRLEGGEGKSKIVEAKLLYTTNGSDLLGDHRNHEEWFEVPGEINGSVVSAVAPPGMTHGVFYLRDENNFLVTSEPIPPQLGKGNDPGFRGSSLQDGYAWLPGLASLIRTGEAASRSGRERKADTAALDARIGEASAVLAKPFEEPAFAAAMSNLRGAIRALAVPEAELPVLHRFVSPKWTGDAQAPGFLRQSSPAS
ncbi:MAG: sulfatase [Chthoniobacterales bacterium]